MVFPLLLLSVLPTQAETLPDHIVLKGGKQLQGIILFQDPKTLILGQKSTERKIRRISVMSMEGPRLAFPEYVEHLQRVYSARADADQAVALAQWCQEKGLLRDVTMHYWRALELDPGHAQANLALDHRLRGAAWTCPTGSGAWVSVEDLETRRLENNEPWILSSAHFDLQASGSLHDVLRAAATLEVLYFHFYQLLQPLGGFYELRKPLEVRIHRDRDSGYPELGPSIFGYFDETSDITHTWFEQGQAVNLVRILTHALQYRAAFERTRGNPEQYPGWLYEGLATYFESCYQTTDGTPDYLPARLHGAWLQLHARASSVQRNDLDTLLNFQRSGIGQAKDAQLVFAEVYTLCFFLLQSQDLRTQESWKTYLHSAFLNRGDASQFRKAFSKRQRKKLVQDWADFVETTDLRLRLKRS